MRSLMTLILAAAAAAVIGPAEAASTTGPATIVRLTAVASCAEPAALTAAGARKVDAKLRLWRLDPDAAGSLLPALERRGSVAAKQLERTYDIAATAVDPDPLQTEEWWLAQIGVEGQTPPGPGVPVTIVDSGVVVEHPEFAGRPDLSVLYAQEPAGIGGEHGTSVASVIGAPALERREERSGGVGLETPEP